MVAWFTGSTTAEEEMQTDKRRSPPSKRSNAERKRYGKALRIMSVVFATQAVVAYVFLSLTLTGDTIHVGSDLSVIGGSWFIAFAASREAFSDETRVRKLFAYAGILLLVGGAFYVLFEAYERLQNPVFHPSIWVLIVAVSGGCGNFWVHRILHRTPKEEHNHTHRVLSAHVLSDLALSVVVVVAWTATFAFGWQHADSVFSVLVAGYMFFLSGRLFQTVRGETSRGH